MNDRTGVTDLIITSADLVEANKRYQALLSSLHDGIIMYDRNLRVLACNPAADEILGLACERMHDMGEQTGCWIGEDGTPRTEADHPARQALTTGQPVRNTIMGRHRPDRTTIWISMNATPLFHDPEIAPASVVVSFSDITAQRLIEVERQQTQRFTTRSPTGCR